MSFAEACQPTSLARRPPLASAKTRPEDLDLGAIRLRSRVTRLVRRGLRCCHRDRPTHACDPPGTAAAGRTAGLRRNRPPRAGGRATARETRFRRPMDALPEAASEPSGSTTRSLARPEVVLKELPPLPSSPLRFEDGSPPGAFRRACETVRFPPSLSRVEVSFANSPGANNNKNEELTKILLIKLLTTHNRSRNYPQCYPQN